MVDETWPGIKFDAYGVYVEGLQTPRDIIAEVNQHHKSRTVPRAVHGTGRGYRGSLGIQQSAEGASNGVEAHRDGMHDLDDGWQAWVESGGLPQTE